MYYNPKESELKRLGFDSGDEIKLFSAKSIKLLVSLLEGFIQKSNELFFLKVLQIKKLLIL